MPKVCSDQENRVYFKPPPHILLTICISRWYVYLPTLHKILICFTGIQITEEIAKFVNLETTPSTYKSESNYIMRSS